MSDWQSSLSKSQCLHFGVFEVERLTLAVVSNIVLQACCVVLGPDLVAKEFGRSSRPCILIVCTSGNHRSVVALKGLAARRGAKLVEYGGIHVAVRINADNCLGVLVALDIPLHCVQAWLRQLNTRSVRY